MPRPQFRSDIAESINKLVPRDRGGNQTLVDREPREPIGVRKGRGTLSEAAANATALTGTVTSADGMFVIEYDYHAHVV